MNTAALALVIGAVPAFVASVVEWVEALAPLTIEPENFMKFVVGAMLTTFGIFWGAEGMEVHWPIDASSLLVILAGVCLVSWIAVRMLSLIAPQGARVAAALHVADGALAGESVQHRPQGLRCAHTPLS